MPQLGLVPTADKICFHWDLISIMSRHFGSNHIGSNHFIVVRTCGGWGSQGRLESGIFHGSTSNTKKVLCRGSDRGIFQIQTSIGNP